MIEDLQVVKVGMADLNVVQGSGIIRTTGLGSCVGLTLYDPAAHIVGMAHVMLPSSETAREGQLNLMKYADTAIPMLLEKIDRLGGIRRRLVAKMAGGAQMFAFNSMSDTMRIGPRNVENCKEMLKQFSIPLLAEDTGGNYGRTVEMNCQTGILHIRSVQIGVKEI
ncbi:chemotaxis protein CheD [Paenibacillus selenitireducens]|uniref:Probable chemoreceptor glutamine deamidase CheD n=1 Tax=Paenibacillus selenitireducens TaxID=1324314 RepID=A0A1T2XCH6_9BACL|nr:chemotaxis protein CheD [Paenibacillus selenitireducens]OPA77617.1 chemotaxis protein CheD [Paenibacillus selenitireducens]